MQRGIAVRHAKRRRDASKARHRVADRLQNRRNRPGELADVRETLRFTRLPRAYRGRFIE